MDTEGVKVLFGNIMQPFKSAFGIEEKTDEKKEYTKSARDAMISIFALCLFLPLIYLAYVQFGMKINVYGEITKLSNNGKIYIGLGFLFLFGLIGFSVTLGTTKVKDDSKGEVKK
jgi:hypothetical protein